MIVADTNLIAYLVIDGQHTAVARRIREQDPDWRVPPLWRSEFLNVLATAVRSGVLTEEQAFLAWDLAVSIVGRSEVEPGAAAVLATALRRGLSAYDAQFVVVAESLRALLVTGDRKILRACPDVAAPMLDHAAQGRSSR